MARRAAANNRGRSWIVYPSRLSFAIVIFMIGPDGADSDRGAAPGRKKPPPPHVRRRVRRRVSVPVG